jgi:hypothetical protein
MKGALRVFSYVPLIMCALIFAAPSGAADREIARVGDEAISDADMLFMISEGAGDSGDGMRTGLALVQMDKRARAEMAGQMANELMYAAAAREAGFDKTPEAARMLRWQEVRALAGLYLANISASWDLSDAAAKKYYDGHPDEFVQAEAVRMRYAALPPGSDDLYPGLASQDLTTLEIAAASIGVSVDLSSVSQSDWMEKGLVRAEFVTPFFSSGRIGVLAPVKLDGTSYLIEITDRRPPRQLSWDEASHEARQRLQRYLLASEAERLKAKYPVRIDEGALMDLGSAASGK